MKKPEFQIWWIPQVGAKGVPMFEFTVPTIEAGRILEDALAQYDLFQLKHKIKPDFANAGGVIFRHEAVTGGEWWEINDKDEEEDFLAEIAKYEADPEGYRQ